MTCQRLQEQDRMSDYFDLDCKEVEVSPDEDTCQPQLYTICRPSKAFGNDKENGYTTIDDAMSSSKPTSITDHPCYHGVMSRNEANELLILAPQRGYITRYSEGQNKYILSIAFPSSKKEMDIQHFLFAIDNEVPSYALKGGGKSFRSIEDLLKFYETHWLTPKLGTIGNAYTQIDTTLWWKENEIKKKKEEEEKKKKEEEEKKRKEEEKKRKEEEEEKKRKEEEKKKEEEEKKRKEEEEKKRKEEDEKTKGESEEERLNILEAEEKIKGEAEEQTFTEQEQKKPDIVNEQDKLKAQQEQLLQMQTDMVKQQMMFQQQMEDLKKGMMEPLVNQQKEYQQQILELQKANTELLQTIQREQHHHKCCLQ